MSRPARAAAALTLTLAVLLLCSVGPSYAGGLQQAPQPTAGLTATSRLRELQGLLVQGLVTQAEYDRRRQAIIDSV